VSFVALFIATFDCPAISLEISCGVRRRPDAALQNGDYGTAGTA
jgi:hypothetical protein